MELLKSANVPIYLLITLARTVLSHRTSLSSSDLMFAESNTSSEVGGRLIDNDAEDEVVNGDPLRLFVRAGVRKNPPEDPEGPGKTPFWAFLSSEESRFLLLVPRSPGGLRLRLRESNMIPHWLRFQTSSSASCTNEMARRMSANDLGPKDAEAGLGPEE